MIWSDFMTQVNNELGVEAQRYGTANLRARAAQDCAVDLQRFIRAFRQGQTTTYQVTDLTTVTDAQVGNLPAQAKPKAFYTVSTHVDSNGNLVDPNCRRNRMDYCAWEDRRRMVCRKDRDDYWYSIAPFSDQFMIHPVLNTETYLYVVWDGLKSSFAAGDVVPWPEWACEAFGLFIRRRILAQVDKRLDLANEIYDPATKRGTYAEARLKLFREQREAQYADGKDEEYQAGSFPAPVGFYGFSPNGIPLLGTVTMLEGATTAALAAVPTKQLPVPVTVMVLIGGINQIWTLKSGTDADDPTNGVVRPNDYDGTSNQRVWYHSTV